MRPTHTDTTPRLSLLGPSSGDIIDQHTGCEDACFKRIALMIKNFPENVLKKGCQTIVTVLCLEKDLKVKAMLDTGCSPNNYMRAEYFEQHEAYLSRYIIKDLSASIWGQVWNTQGSPLRHGHKTLRYLIPFYGSYT
jgi:hypothetical protein